MLSESKKQRTPESPSSKKSSSRLLGESPPKWPISFKMMPSVTHVRQPSDNSTVDLESQPDIPDFPPPPTSVAVAPNHRQKVFSMKTGHGLPTAPISQMRTIEISKPAAYNDRIPLTPKYDNGIFSPPSVKTTFSTSERALVPPRPPLPPPVAQLSLQLRSKHGSQDSLRYGCGRPNALRQHSRSASPLYSARQMEQVPVHQAYIPGPPLARSAHFAHRPAIDDQGRKASDATSVTYISDSDLTPSDEHNRQLNTSSAPFHVSRHAGPRSRTNSATRSPPRASFQLAQKPPLGLCTDSGLLNLSSTASSLSPIQASPATGLTYPPIPRPSNISSQATIPASPAAAKSINTAGRPHMSREEHIKNHISFIQSQTSTTALTSASDIIASDTTDSTPGSTIRERRMDSIRDRRRLDGSVETASGVLQARLDLNPAALSTSENQKEWRVVPNQEYAEVTIIRRKFNHGVLGEADAVRRQEVLTGFRNGSSSVVRETKPSMPARVEAGMMSPFRRTLTPLNRNGDLYLTVQ